MANPTNPILDVGTALFGIVPLMEREELILSALDESILAGVLSAR
jgi:hypothetical protein